MNILLYLIIFLLLLCIYIQFERSKNFDVTKKDLSVPDLPDGFNGLKIIHLSDLHVSKYGKREERIRHIIKEEKPDIIFITGDFVSNSWGITPCLKTIDGIAAPLGVWAVWGNNDNGLKAKVKRLKEGLDRAGIKILTNENILIKLKDSKIRLIGVDDPHRKKDNLKLAMEGTSEEEFKILLAHSPVIIREAADMGINIVLAGHTHGGQVRFPFLGAIYNHTWDLFRYSAGMFRVKSTIMYVSRGLGMSVIPIRFLCNAEFIIFTLKK
ncbi:MAG: metallophosphoesterase [Candidatus Eremiobacterota bacterium]